MLYRILLLILDKQKFNDNNKNQRICLKLSSGLNFVHHPGIFKRMQMVDAFSKTFLK